MAIILSGKEGKIAERVIIVGNLGRMKTITSMLNELETVNEFAGYYTYTGKYNGKSITVNFHGIGNSSLALITNDLISLGAKYIVRFGSATGVSDKADAGTAVVPIGYSYNIGGFALQELGEMINFAATGNLDLINLLVDSLKKSGVKVATGNMFTSDSIHSHDEKFLQKWRSLNHLAVDLEGAALYFEGARHGISTGAVHLIYRNPMTGKSMSQADIERTEKEISKSILDALTKL
jgi:uridine phosphorylase